MTQPSVDQFEQSKLFCEKINLRRNRIQVQVEAGRQQLLEANREAEATYKTSDFAKLTDILASREADNTAKAVLFQSTLAELDVLCERLEAAQAVLAKLATAGSPALRAAMLAAMLPDLPADVAAMLTAVEIKAPPSETPTVAAVAFSSEDI